MSKPLVPTIGRRMYFFCSTTLMEEQGLVCLSPDAPFDACVIYVHDESHVNVQVTDHEGNIFAATDCPVVTDDNREYTLQAKLHYWVEWMPYQVQAAKDAVPETTSIGLSYAQTGGE